MQKKAKVIVRVGWERPRPERTNEFTGNSLNIQKQLRNKFFKE